MSALIAKDSYSLGHLTASIVLYEPSFEGWLSAVYYVYDNKLQHDPSLQLTAQDCYVPSLISAASSVAIDDEKAQRVLIKLNKLLGRSGMRQVLWGFLSEKVDIGTTLFQVIKYAIDYPKRAILQDLGNLYVLELAQTVKSVGREKHRMEAFVRFEHTTDDIYFARVEPDFNVLPLIGEHFRQRYQDQHWAIYDLARGYGIYYDKSQSTASRPAELQTITDLDNAVLRNPASIHSADEQRYQRFWQGYFTNVNIKERKNSRLHKQYLPQRYWKYLSEKQILPNADYLQKRR
ncbi:TIGR03915 family putative DNA repair protein [Psychrobacter sp. TAE2020]|uniref:TIGR03915 family putative DNA repair protein n=1 Tax=Psychrobacter sp. TAE2020 TaxID=2846762 RepID=UPI001C0F7E79|nr:TIGR03915 family putative DNA repair protein [Psychrobacter sp. TAE2020]MBU5616240.1 TIGR03915 family putative DNA repair protein [Psychrobacter sp. TAE2020]